MFLAGLFLRAVWRERIFYPVDLLPVSIHTYMRKFKNNLSGEMCKIDKPPSLSVKTLKTMTPEKMENGIFFFKFEILATNIGLS